MAGIVRYGGPSRQATRARHGLGSTSGPKSPSLFCGFPRATPPRGLTLAPGGAILARDQGGRGEVGGCLRSAVAEFEDGKHTCWPATQATHILRKQLVVMLDDDLILTGENSWPKSTAQP